jgi:Predicted amidohydrolase
VKALAEPADALTFKTLNEWAKKHVCHIVYGFAEQADKIYNSSSLIGPEGFIGVYRKVHLFYQENILFAPGNLGFPVFDLPIGKIGMMICFDWLYPESARSLALKGAQIIAHPSNLVLPYCPDGMVTRALENKVFTATADRVGEENRGGVNLKFIGTSEIVTPNGKILCRLGEREPGIAVADIDLALADKKQINEYNHMLKGRRPDQYSL